MEHSIQELEALKDFQGRISSCEILQNTRDHMARPLLFLRTCPAPSVQAPPPYTISTSSRGHGSDQLTTDGSATLLCDVDAFDPL